MNDANRTEADVVVIGGGGAGLTAAYVAARLGRQVVLLEKNPRLGGTTALSVGSITSSCTPFQEAAGIVDSPREHFEDMALFARDAGWDPTTKDNHDLRRLYTENVPGTVRFLMDLGVEFFGPMPEPPNRYPRMHNILPNSRAYIHHLARHCRKAGVDIRTGIAVEHLAFEGDRIGGCEATVDGHRHRFDARRGVVLATGDYSSSSDTKAQFVAPELADIEGINPTSVGDGQRLAREVGAEIVNGDVMLGPEIRFVAPPRKRLIEVLPPGRPLAKLMKWSLSSLPDRILRPFLMSFVTTNLAPSHKLFEEGALLINNQGERFCEESDNPQLAIPTQPDRVAFIVFDAAIARQFTAWPHFISTAPGVAYAYLPDYRRNRRDIFFKAPTMVQLAARLGVPENALTQTVEGYNSVQRGQRPAIADPPFYALGPAKSWIVLTDGGARVTGRMEVMDKDGAVIPGLYAAGSAGQGGLLLEGHGHHLGWAFTSGRIAGQHAAFGWSAAALG